MNIKNKWVQLIPIFFLACLFILVRINPLIFENVIYTYDQGRDFLKASAIIRNLDLTFIGPTTGITGVYHGAWWYYLLAIPYVIFNGNPIGFYYFIFFIQFFGFFVLNWFLEKNFESNIRYLILLIVAVSPYFIGTSLFLGNNVMVLPVMLGFLISCFYLIENKSKNTLLTLFLVGLFLGFIAEFEFAFGLMIIPVFILLSICFKQIRNSIYKIKNFIYFFVGLLIPFSLRILFELKNSFFQTRVLIDFIFHPKFYIPKAFIDILKDRLSLFFGYINGTFIDTFSRILFFIFLILFVFLIKNKKNKFIEFSKFVFSLFLLLFIFSCLYKDNFWLNYYEGIQYIIVFFFMLVLNFINKNYKFGKYLIWLITFSIFFTFLLQFHNPFKNEKEEGLIIQKKAVEYIAKKEGLKNYCVEIYTPPAIPHTYNYLFQYFDQIKITKIPYDYYYEGKCWFIVESDDYKERRQKWLDEHFFKKQTLLDYKKINKDIEVFKYQEIK